jgi:flagellar motor switch protein FliM
LSPGTILQFNKACDEALQLEVGDHPVALGETVKVGDKFGLWITSIVMPGERYWVITANSGCVRVK